MPSPSSKHGITTSKPSGKSAPAICDVGVSGVGISQDGQDTQDPGAPGADGNCNCNACPYMALNTIEKLYVALRDLQPRIEIEEGLRLRAKRSLDRMLEMAASTVGKGDVGRPQLSGD